jgi:pimeloyl-ACP methyl ester carboxylesterase
MLNSIARANGLQAITPPNLVKLACLVLIVFSSAPLYADIECVVLLHGLARTSDSMGPLEETLSKNGYQVANINYASRHNTIEQLAPTVIREGLDSCADASIVHFVTHSLGGILVRYYLANQDIQQLGYVVMLAPPNQGSEVVDNWQNIPGYKSLNGPAGLQLGTGAQSIPKQLGPVLFPLGIIAGTRTINPLLSLSLPNPDDGKVSVENTKVDGMADFIEVPHTHTFIMRSETVIQQVLHFLKHGRFAH